MGPRQSALDSRSLEFAEVDIAETTLLHNRDLTLGLTDRMIRPSIEKWIFAAGLYVEWRARYQQTFLSRAPVKPIALDGAKRSDLLRMRYIRGDIIQDGAFQEPASVTHCSVSTVDAWGSRRATKAPRYPAVLPLPTFVQCQCCSSA